MNDKIPEYGPLYKETDMSQFIVEPWSTFSNFLFTILIVYWFVKIWNQKKEYRFLFFSLFIVAISNIGGIIYHAKRDALFWLLLDALPIMILALSVGIYFWIKIKAKWYVWGASILLPFALVFLAHSIFKIPDQVAPNIGYTAMAITIITPVILFLFKTKFQYSMWFFASVVGFGISIFFRIIDLESNISFLPMGTHWLWHTFGAFSTHFLIMYIYLNRKMELGKI